VSLRRLALEQVRFAAEAAQSRKTPVNVELDTPESIGFGAYHLPQFLQHHESLSRGHNARHAGASPPPQASAVDAEPWHAAPGQDDPVVGDPQHGVPASGTGTSFPLGDLVVDVQGQLEDRGTRLGDARVQSLDLDQAGEELGLWAEVDRRQEEGQSGA